MNISSLITSIIIGAQILFSQGVAAINSMAQQNEMATPSTHQCFSDCKTQLTEVGNLFIPSSEAGTSWTLSAYKGGRSASIAQVCVAHCASEEVTFSPTKLIASSVKVCKRNPYGPKRTSCIKGFQSTFSKDLQLAHKSVLAKIEPIDTLQIVASPSTVQSEALSHTAETVRKIEIENSIDTKEHTEMLQSEVDLKLVLGFDHCVYYEAHCDIESSNTTAPAPTASDEVQLASIGEFPVSYRRSNLGKPLLAVENHYDTVLPDDVLSSSAELEQKSRNEIVSHNVIRVEWRNYFTGLETTQNARFIPGIFYSGITVEGQHVPHFDNWSTSMCSLCALPVNQNAGTASIKPLRQCTLTSHFDRAIEEHKHPFNAHSGGAISFDTADPNCIPPHLHALTTDVLCASDHYDGSKRKWKLGNSTTLYIDTETLTTSVRFGLQYQFKALRCRSPMGELISSIPRWSLLHPQVRWYSHVHFKLKIDTEDTLNGAVLEEDVWCMIPNGTMTLSSSSAGIVRLEWNLPSWFHSLQRSPLLQCTLPSVLALVKAQDILEDCNLPPSFDNDVVSTTATLSKSRQLRTAVVNCTSSRVALDYHFSEHHFGKTNSFEGSTDLYMPWSLHRFKQISEDYGPLPPTEEDIIIFVFLNTCWTPISIQDIMLMPPPDILRRPLKLPSDRGTYCEHAIHSLIAIRCEISPGDVLGIEVMLLLLVVTYGLSGWRSDLSAVIIWGSGCACSVTTLHRSFNPLRSSSRVILS
jgi:hypothetical protein